MPIIRKIHSLEANHKNGVSSTIVARPRSVRAIRTGIIKNPSTSAQHRSRNPPSIIKHQKGLKSTLHLPKLEYPCFSQPVNTEGRKYGRGAVNIIKGNRESTPAPEGGHYPLSRTLPSPARRPPLDRQNVGQIDFSAPFLCIWTGIDFSLVLLESIHFY